MANTIRHIGATRKSSTEHGISAIDEIYGLYDENNDFIDIATDDQVEQSFGCVQAEGWIRLDDGRLAYVADL
jgi:hypothetical protein